MSQSISADRTFHIIIKRMVETGQAPHYTELASELGVTPEEGKKVLHDLFGEEEPSSNGFGGGVDSTDSPLRELKTIILSIDWEITDEVMTKLIEQIAVLKKTFKDDKIPLVFLQLLGSLGEYIKFNIGKSHPDAFKILNSLFNELDKVVQLETLTESEKKQILSIEVNKYKTLKKTT